MILVMLYIHNYTNQSHETPKSQVEILKLSEKFDQDYNFSKFIMKKRY